MFVKLTTTMHSVNDLCTQLVRAKVGSWVQMASSVVTSYTAGLDTLMWQNKAGSVQLKTGPLVVALYNPCGNLIA